MRHWQTVRLLLTALAVSMLLPLATARAGTDAPVGRIITPRGPVCTGVLIGEYTVLTAAHCLVNRAGDGYFSPGLIHFALYPESGDQLYAIGADHTVNPAYPLPVGTAADQLAEDWAVLVLTEPLGRDITPATVVTEADWKAGDRWALEVIAFGRARALRPTVNAQSCRLLDRDSALIRHSCVVEPGSSGSVLIGTRDGRRHAVAVNVAVRRGADARTTAALLPGKIAGLAALVPDAPARAFESPFRGTDPGPWNRTD